MVLAPKLLPLSQKVWKPVSKTLVAMAPSVACGAEAPVERIHDLGDGGAGEGREGGGASSREDFLLHGIS